MREHGIFLRAQWYAWTADGMVPIPAPEGEPPAAVPTVRAVLYCWGCLCDDVDRGQRECRLCGSRDLQRGATREEGGGR